jgi:hypothetical protein
MLAALFSNARLSRGGPQQAQENKRSQRFLLCGFEHKNTISSEIAVQIR